MPRRVGLGRLARWLDTAIHPLRVIPAHPRLPKIAAKGSAQRCDGVTERGGSAGGRLLGCSMNQARPHVGRGREGLSPYGGSGADIIAKPQVGTV